MNPAIKMKRAGMPGKDAGTAVGNGTAPTKLSGYKGICIFDTCGSRAYNTLIAKKNTGGRKEKPMKRRENDTFYSDTQINFFECDAFSEARASTLLKRLNDFAGVDYTDRGYSHDYLWKNNMVFLVSRVSMNIIEPVLPDVPLTFATYERGTKGPLFYRDLFIADENGKTVVACKTAWILCDPVSRRILRPSAFEKKIGEHWDRVMDCAEPKRLTMRDDTEPVGSRRINYSDLDGNGHVNNGVYADIACDFLPYDLFEKKRVRELQINFQREAKIGESMDVFASKKDGFAAVSGKVDGAVSFICELTFEDR